MEISQCIQLISTIVLALATLALAIITFKYMKQTKRMAKIMQRQFDLMIRPDIVPTFHKSITDDGGFRYFYIVANNSKTISAKIIRIAVVFWHQDFPENKTSITVSERITNIPQAGIMTAEIPISGLRLRELFPSAETLEKIIMQLIFFAEDLDKNVIEFRAESRPVGK